MREKMDLLNGNERGENVTPCGKHMAIRWSITWSENKEKKGICLAGWISHVQARGKGWKIRINRDVTGRDKGMWVKERNKGKNKEKCVNRAIVPDRATPLWLHSKYTDSCNHNVLDWHVFCPFIIYQVYAITFYLSGSRKIYSQCDQKVLSLGN